MPVPCLQGNSNGASPHPLQGGRKELTASSEGTGGRAERSIGGIYVADVNFAYVIDGAIRSAACINDRIVWTAEGDGGLRVRSLPKGMLHKDLDMRMGTSCCCLLYVPLRHRMWAAFEDGYVRVYNATSCALINEFDANPETGHAGRNKVYAMVELEGFVFIGCEDACIVQRNALNSRLERVLRGHEGSVRALAIYMGPTGSVVFSGGADGLIKAWNPYRDDISGSNGKAVGSIACIHTFGKWKTQPSSSLLHRAILSLEVVPYTNKVWSGGEDYAVRVWDLETLKCEAVLSGAHVAPVTCLLALESRMWTGDAQGHILLWDMVTLTVLQDLTDRGQPGIRRLQFMRKMQLVTSWKVWVAGSSGPTQCWNAETTPILFNTSYAMKSGTVQLTGDDRDGIRLDSESWAVDVAQLGFSMAYERDRLVVHRELQTQQLFEEENAYLKKRVQCLEAALPLQTTARSPQPESLTPSHESGFLSSLRQDREFMEKELKLLRDENGTLLRLLEQHVQGREAVEHLKDNSFRMERCHTRSRYAQTQVLRRDVGTEMRSPSSSTTSMSGGGGTRINMLRSTSPVARRPAQKLENHERESEIEKGGELVHYRQEYEALDWPLRTHIEGKLSASRHECDEQQARIRRLIEEKAELQQELVVARQQKVLDGNQSIRAQSITNDEALEQELASLRKELHAAKLASVKKTVDLLKLRKELSMLKHAEMFSGDGVSLQSTSFSGLHQSVSSGNPELVTSSTSPNAGVSTSTVRPLTTTGSGVAKEATPQQPLCKLSLNSVQQDPGAPSLEAQNLALSVRLTDAESVATELKALLIQCMELLTEEQKMRLHPPQNVGSFKTTIA